MNKILDASYFLLAASLILNLVVTGFLWAAAIVKPKSTLAPFKRVIRSVHLGSIMMLPIFIGLDLWFDKLQFTRGERLWFPLSLLLGFVVLVVGLFLPRSRGKEEPVSIWAGGWPTRMTLAGLGIFSAGLLWTAVLLVWKALSQ